MIRPEIVYDSYVVRSLLQVMVPEPISFSGQTPIFRTLTFRVLATLLMTQAFNKSCTPKCLQPDDVEVLNRGYLQACRNMIHVINNEQQD